MSEATNPYTTSRPSLTLERFDLDVHPDGLLMRLCGSLQRLRGQLEALERAIECIPAVTIEGRRLKELTL
jgi:hypothetical protein